MTDTTFDKVMDTAGRACLALLIVGAVLIIEPYTANPSDGKTLFLHLMVTVLAVLAVVRIGTDTASPKRSPFYYLFALLVVLSVISWSAHSFGLRGILSTFQLASLALVWWSAFVFVRSPQQFDRLAGAYCAAMGAAAVYGLAQRFGWDPFPWDPRYLGTPEYRQLPATFGNPNVAGHALVPALILACYLAIARRWRRAWIPLGLVATHLALTGHRSGWAAFAAGALVIGCSTWTARRFHSFHSRMMVMGGLSLAALVVCALLGAGTVWIKSGGPLEQSLALRLNSFYGASKMIADNPVLGVGPGNYEVASVRYWTPFEQETFARDIQYNDHPHNEALNTAAELGVAGGAVFVLIEILAIVLTLGWAFASPPGAARTLAITLAGLFTAFFADGMLGFNWRSIPSAVIYTVALGAAARMSSSPVRSRASASNWALASALGLFLIAMLYVEGNVFTSKAFLQRAIGAAEQGYLQEAEESVTRASRWGGWGWRADVERGRIAYARGNIDDAIDAFTVALELHPNCISAWIELCRAALARTAKGPDPSADLDRAENAAARALRLCAPLPQGEELLGRVALARATRDTQAATGLNEQAREHFRYALAFGSRNASEIHRLMAETHRLEGDDGAVFHEFALSAKADPANEALWRAFESFVRDSIEADRMRAALIGAETALVSSGENPAALAAVRSRLGWLTERNFYDPDRALHYFRSAVEVAPDSLPVWRRFAEFALKTGRLDSLRAAFLDVFAKNLSERTTLPAALAGLRETWADNPDAARGSFTVANAVRELSAIDDHRLEDVAWAVDVLAADATGRNGPVDRQAITNLAAAYTAMKKPDLAEALLRGVEWRPTDENYATAILLRADALEKLGRLPEAISVLDDAVTRRSDLIELRLTAARMKARAGKSAAARFEYQSILSTFALEPAARASVEQEMGTLR
ncbi:MAG: O-antigen ligase family protein [Candidatus Hydrogenedentota bacterium]